jgi:metallophosphoesterase (TIGR00282 family)
MSSSEIRVLFVGDVMGQAGRRFLRPALRRLRVVHDPHLVVVNGENAAGGYGLTPATAEELFRAGAEVITTGNHIWDRREIVDYLDKHERLLRPANYPAPAPGSGVCVLEVAGRTVAVANLMGRLFMSDVDDPFRRADEILADLEPRTSTILVDFHAEATSEKIAMGWHLDGRVSAVIGTHTHVATADARVLPGGTAYVTDIGMTGAYDSVIGVRKEEALERFLTQRPVRLSPADGDVRLAGALVEIGANGRAASIRRLELPADGGPP